MGSPEFPLRKVPGFEGTHYVMVDGQIRWAGPLQVAHPRNLVSPYMPPAAPAPTQAQWLRMRELALGIAVVPAKGLMCWRLGQAVPFPLDRAAARFDRIAQALRSADGTALLSSCEQVLGLGPGLTPSGDDFLGGLFFALACSPSWRGRPELAQVRDSLIQRACDPGMARTNVISAALMADLMRQHSYQPVHDLMHAMSRLDGMAVQQHIDQLAQVGSSSGFDILAGLFTAIIDGTSP